MTITDFKNDTTIPYLKVIRKKDGKTWILFHAKNGFYLSCNDGDIPCGQFINWSTAIELFDVAGERQ